MFFSVFSPKNVIGFLKFLCQLFYDKVIIMIKSIMKNYKKVFRHTIFSIKYAMHSTTIFPCIMTMISNFTIFLIFQTSIFKFFLQISNDSCCCFVNNFIFFFLKLIIFIACSFKDSQHFFIQLLPLYASCLFSMLLNVDIVDIEKPDGIGLLICCGWIFRIIFTSINLFIN